MKPIVITHPLQLKNEFEAISALFENGLEILHVRKPDFTKQELQEWIKSVDEKFHKYMMIHNHLPLAEEMNLKGVHFTSYNRHLINEYKDCNCQKSTSTHSIDELKQWDERVDYAFFSPVFESISKKGYKPTMAHEELQVYLHTNHKASVIALGGIDSNNVEKTKEIGFDGFAILGALWSKFEKDHNIKELINQYNEIANN